MIRNKRATLRNVLTRRDGGLRCSKLPRKIPYRVTNQREEKEN